MVSSFLLQFFVQNFLRNFICNSFKFLGTLKFWCSCYGEEFLCFLVLCPTIPISLQSFFWIQFSSAAGSNSERLSSFCRSFTFTRVSTKTPIGKKQFPELITATVNFFFFIVALSLFNLRRALATLRLRIESSRTESSQFL